MKASAAHLRLAHFFILLLVLSPFLLYFYDIASTGALRQGTEGFYLQIVAEMKERGSLMVPYHSGVPHFSKPPLGFWLALPLINTFGLDTLFGARLAILLASLLLFVLISRSVARNLNYNWVIVLMFALSTFGAVKYSRIFMLESPLSLLGTLAGLWLYESFKKQSLKSALLAGAALGLAGLTKGPVSFVMAGLSLVIYFLMIFKIPAKSELIKMIVALASALVVFLPWFLILGAQFGDYFWNYFLVRENLGKFTSKSYPVSVLFQGLFLFLLPWSLIFLAKIKGLNHKWLQRSKSERSYMVFLGAFALGHFLIWFIPSQRSHHYAYPATFFVLFMIMPLLNEAKTLKRVLLILLGLTYLLLGYLSFVFSYPYSLLIAMSFLLLIFAWRGATRYFISLWSLALLCLWYIVAPRYALPIMPANVADVIGNTEITVAVRKPFFISEELGRDIVIVKQHKMKPETVTTSLLLTDEAGAPYLDRLPDYTIKLKYDVWKRGASFKEIVNAIQKRDLSSLKSGMYLLEKN